MPRRFAPACTLCACLIAATAPLAALDDLAFISAREKGMGGRHVALADDSTVLLSNPAGLADLQSSYSAADLSVQAIGPVFDIANLFLGGSPSTASIIDFLAKNNYRLYAGVDVSGPIACGFTGDGLGFGVFNKTKVIVNIASINSIKISADEDMLLAGGYAFRFDLGRGHELSAGIVAKGYVLGGIESSRGIIEAIGLFSDPTSVLSDTFTLTTGIGADAGLRWSWNGRVAAALECANAFSPAVSTPYTSASAFVSDPAGSQGESSYVTLPRSLNFGLMWSPELGRVNEVIDSLVLALDYKDILDLFSTIPRNPILNVSLGLETRILQIVTLRAGIADALPSAGLGLDLTVFKLNFAAYGTELGLDPGDRTAYNLLVDFDFRY
jgi:hypothetical protein